MPKVMLVEDDNNLREIYEARLLAEGYQIVSARDGEEALAMAVKEKPDLIISDIMMPKISGFDMLDILRSTPETKNTKVIMMTALSQAEDKARADKLGADRYLVKSQVTLEDVAKVAKEILGGETPGAGASQQPDPPTPNTPQSPATPTTDAAPTNQPTTTDPAATPADSPSDDPKSSSAPPTGASTQQANATVTQPLVTTTQTIDSSQTTAEEENQVKQQINNFVSQPSGASTPPSADSVQPSAETVIPDAPSEEKTQTITPQKIDVVAPPADNPVSTAPTMITPQSTSKTSETIPKTEISHMSAMVNSETNPKDKYTTIHERVITPLNDITAQAPDLNKLVEKEVESQGLPQAPPTTVINPGGQAIQPAGTVEPPDPHRPGNVIHPVGGAVDASSIAL
ncbi:MAG TPA: response regulator [Patescibacteria group bacterium]|nr:response regulator [Patescibacteria group bacterium]